MARKALKTMVKAKAKLSGKTAVKSKAKLSGKTAVKSKAKLSGKTAVKSRAKSPVNPKPQASKKPKKKIKADSRFDDIKRALIIQRETLLSKAGMGFHDVTGRVGSCPDLTDQASVESDQAFELKLKEREQNLLTKIAETLERISQGTYGICLNCENPIPHPRLKVRPVTSLCIECKTIEEEQENIRMGSGMLP